MVSFHNNLYEQNTTRLTAQLKMIPAKMRLAPRQSKRSSRKAEKGAMMIEPKPAPHVVIPIARGRFLSKYWPTQTTVGI